MFQSFVGGGGTEPSVFTKTMVSLGTETIFPAVNGTIVIEKTEMCDVDVCLVNPSASGLPSTYSSSVPSCLRSVTLLLVCHGGGTHTSLDLDLLALLTS